MKKLLLFVIPGLLLLMNGCDKNESTINVQTETLKADTNTLITIDFVPYSVFEEKIYFILADEYGTIINSVEYKDGTSPFKISSKKPFNKERINVFMVSIPSEKNRISSVFAYLQVKKGSVWSNKFKEKPEKPFSFPLKFRFIPGSDFEHITYSTDVSGTTVVDVIDTTFASSQGFTYSDDSKIFVQVQKNSQVLYNFLDITKGTHDYIIDLEKCTKVSSSKIITNPGDFTQMSSYGIPDTNYRNRYYLGYQRSYNNKFNYYFPSEPFQKYLTTINYDKNDLTYWNTFVGAEIHEKVDHYDIKFSVGGEYLSNFKPEVSGKFDYYEARFVDKYPVTFSVAIHSPSSAHYSDIKFPDFSKCIDAIKFDFDTQKITNFNVYQIDNFNEKKLYYNMSGEFASISSNARAVLKRYK